MRRLLRWLSRNKKHEWVEIESVETKPYYLPIIVSKCRWCGFLREREGIGRERPQYFWYAWPDDINGFSPPIFRTAYHWGRLAYQCP